MKTSTVSNADTQEQARVLSGAVVRAAERLGINNSSLAKILGLSPASVSRLGTSKYYLVKGRKEWEFGVLFVRMFRSLDTLTGEAAQAWLKGANNALNGQPAEIIQTTEGLVRVVNYLDGFRGRV